MLAVQLSMILYHMMLNYIKICAFFESLQKVNPKAGILSIVEKYFQLSLLTHLLNPLSPIDDRLKLVSRSDLSCFSGSQRTGETQQCSGLSQKKEKKRDFEGHILLKPIEAIILPARYLCQILNTLFPSFSYKL